MELPLVDFKCSELVRRSSGSTSDSFSYGPISFEELHSNQARVDRNTAPLEEHEILTSSGIYQRVYVQPSQCKRALITYHDIGTNHISFLGFFNNPKMRVMTKHFTVYHICAPGHHENAATEIFHGPVVDSQAESTLMGENRSGRSPELARSSAVTSTIGSYPTLDQLAEMLTSILGHFRIDDFIGFGMGAGSNVLARYALHHPEKILGLFLLNPTSNSHSYYQRLIFRWWEWSKIEQSLRLPESVLDQLDNHWFGYNLSENTDVLRFYHELAHSLNPLNLAGYIHSFINRTPLNLIRPVFESSFTRNEGTHEPTVIRTDVCLVTGDRATDLSRNLADMNGCMDPQCTQFILIPDCTGMVMEENPDKLAIDFLHFLRSIGLVITLTPEKLRQEATALQLERIRCAYSLESCNALPHVDLINEA